MTSSDIIERSNTASGARLNTGLFVPLKLERRATLRLERETFTRWSANESPETRRRRQ
jgi:hypothetical protein